MEKTGSENRDGSAGAREPVTVLAWRVHLLKEQPRRLLLILPAVFISLSASLLIFRSPVMPGITFLLLFFSLADYLFPISYEIREDVVMSRGLTSRSVIPWNRVRKCYLDGHGVKLSPLEAGGRLEAYRGVYLRFARNRDEVIAAVRRLRDVRSGCPDS